MPLCPQIKHGGSEAFYAPVNDYIQMPKLEHFKSSESYYAVLFHELIHSTGTTHGSTALGKETGLPNSEAKITLKRN
jgi:antirestriction protein ArdC